jgi:uncharacterized protein YndB with AHSA1/START domain
VKAADYAREFTVGRSVERLFDCIATREGLRGWWTSLVSGSDAVGGTLHLEFEGMVEHIDMYVEAAQRPSKVVWSIVEHSSLDEWTGTKVCFTLSAKGANACTLTFRHDGLSPKLACYEDCEAGWDHFLGSLVSFVERGKGEPFGARRMKP